MSTRLTHSWRQRTERGIVMIAAWTFFGDSKADPNRMSLLNREPAFHSALGKDSICRA